MNEPLAYFLTWHTYGSWLHGHEQGSVDDEHAVFGEPFARSDSERAQRRMRQQPVALAEAARVAAQEAVVEVCRFRGWRLLALHIRTTHVHVVVHAVAPVEKVLVDFKDYATRRLHEEGCYRKDAKIWVVHGST